MKTTILALCALIGVIAAQDQPAMPEMPKPTKQHEWLQQFVGKWTVTSEMQMEPGADPIKGEGTETVTSLGGFWIISDLDSSMMGESFTGKMTIGYNPDLKKFVGTWVDSMTSQMWQYEGMLSEDGKKLALESTGYCLMRGKNCDFRDTLIIIDKDKRMMTSETKDDEGNWITVMTATYTRK